MGDFEQNGVARRVQQVRDRIVDRWSPAREALIGRQLDRRIRRRKRARRISAALLMVLPLGLAVHLATRLLAHEAAIVLADGSRVELRAKGAAVTELAAKGERRVRLTGGSARFDVRSDPSHPFVVELSGSLEVRVLGTVFTVEPDAATVAVSVERGHVLVQRNGDTLADLRQGEQARVPVVAAPTVPTSAVQVETAAVDPPRIDPPRPTAPVAPQQAIGRSRPSSSARTDAPADWRTLADAGDFRAAYAALDERRVEGVEALLMAADVARLSGHPRESIAYLQGVETRFPGDPRAPLAAFTRGRILLEDFGRPREAALAFELVGTLDPSGPLVADALAREVESWSRAGERGAAHARAEHYVRAFPGGARIKSVRLYGDLD